MNNDEIIRVLKIWGRDIDVMKTLDGKTRIAVFKDFYSTIESTKQYDSLEEGLRAIYDHLHWEIFHTMEHWAALKEINWVGECRL